MSTREKLDTLAREKILILDGAMGTMIQKWSLSEDDFRGERFTSHPKALKGCNDILCITRPVVIASIHQAYLRSGADIIETCTFNANAPSLADYSLEDWVYEINLAAAKLARASADLYSTDTHPRFVAGVLGPTSKTCSLSPDVNDPGARGIDFYTLAAAYKENARGLLDGGVDILMVETVFDTLNAKAAVKAIQELQSERGLDIPLMISGTIVDAAGRTLSGQTVEAFSVSLEHAMPWSIGLNCALGAEKMLPHLRSLSGVAAVPISAHPNAGLPNQLGEYDESPEAMATYLESFFREGLVNVAGGCCGSTPAHIAAIARKALQYAPREIPAKANYTALSGLEVLQIRDDSGFVDIGERCNVAGSRKFLRLIQEGNYDKALGIAREMVEAGASIIDVCMDDALLDAKECMVRFLNLALSDPDLARLPFMIDSSRLEVLEAGLACLQGKGIVNSISLKEGPEEFLRRLKIAQSMGAAVVVMLFDEKGQADTYERKIQVAQRSWDLLTAAGFPQRDVIFDPNVLSVATGIPEHDSYALDFIHSCEWIREHCPGALISGGLSNLSFSFRGNNEIREAMHAVFIEHAGKAGLTMAIVNPATLISSEELDPVLRERAEDVVLARRPDAAERLLALAEDLKEEGNSSQIKNIAASSWRDMNLEQRIAHALVKGLDEFIEQDVLEIRPRYARALEIIEGPLMKGMNQVGELFGAGKMFLPQVIRSARVMKRAVAVLEPYVQEEKTQADAGRSAGKIVIATVKGDVHDIGKNIVSVVLACNGYDVIDLGVMVPGEQILDAAEKEGADIIGLSGLITPSLEEMTNVARAMETRGLKIPLMVGGATCSLAHTALRIAPEYSGPVVYSKDASQAALAVRALLSDTERPRFLERLEVSYREAVERHEAQKARISWVSLSEARANRLQTNWADYTPPKPKLLGVQTLDSTSVADLIPWIDWSWFFYSWDLGYGFDRVLQDPEKGEAAKKLYDDAQQLLQRIDAERLLRPCGVYGFFPVKAENDDLLVYSSDNPEELLCRFNFPRNQELKKAGGPNPSLADFCAPDESPREDWVGAFTVSTGLGLDELRKSFTATGDDYSALLASSLADRLAEAFAEMLHYQVRTQYWGYAPDEDRDMKRILEAKYRGIRPAFGYPACPDHADKQLVFKLLDVEKNCGLSLTETWMIQPTASVCGLYFSHPAAWYFGCGTLQQDQLEDWAKRKGLSVEEAQKRSGRI